MLSSDPSILQIAYLPDGAFVLPILSRLQQSPAPKVRALAETWVNSGLADLACSLSTKVSMLSLLAERLYGSVTPFLENIASDPRSLIAFRERKTWLPADHRAPYRVLLDVDSFIFEFRSTYEILGKFLVSFFKEILGRPLTEQSIQAELQSRGVDMSWAVELREHRKIFFHQQAPWIAVRVADWEKAELELVVLSDAQSDPSDPSESFTFRRLSAIYAGMQRSLHELQEWVLAEIDHLGRHTSHGQPN